MATATEAMFAKFSALYGDPETPDLKTFLAEYRAAMAAWTDEVIEEVIRQTLKNHVYRSWPTIGDLTSRARDAASAIDRNKPQKPVSFQAPPRGDNDLNLQTRFDLAAQWRRQIVKSHGNIDAWLLEHGPRIKYFWDGQKK